jgi:hypothetical protein
MIKKRSRTKKNTPIKCTGEWSSPSCIEGARSAFLALHNLYPTTRGAEYTESCEKCVSLNVTRLTTAPSVERVTKKGKSAGAKKIKKSEKVTPVCNETIGNGNWKSCRDHANARLLVSHGNAVNADIAKATYNCYQAQLQDQHEVRGNIQILPCNLRKLRKALLGEGLGGLQKWCMVILGVKLFLRVNELLVIKVDDFQCDLNIVHPNSIKSLCLRIHNSKAKGDEPKFQDVMSHKDDICPEFCPLTTLLTYIWASNIKGGFLFPDTSELLHWAGDESEKWQLSEHGVVIAGHGNGHFATHWIYQKWLNLLKVLLEKYCNMEDSDCSRVGTHTLRKTGYLFAIWGILMMLQNDRKRGQHDSPTSGDGSPTRLSELWENEVMKSARHRSITNASKYIQDAFSLHAVCARERFQEENFVSGFVSIIIERASRGNAKQLMVHSHPYQKSNIIEQTEWWIKNVVQVTEARNAEELLRVAEIPVEDEPDVLDKISCGSAGA